MKRRLTQKRDAGVVLICVLVCLGIASAIVLGSVRSSLRARRQMRTEIQLEQTRWLLEAGVIRGVRGLREESDYTGEMWHAGETLAKFDRARVEISVSRDDVPAGSARLSVMASISQDASTAKPTQRSQTVMVDLDRPTSGSGATDI